ncbi:uncharacterized protein LOC131221904 isoform X2 [Magnolia sinica]|uniref:uncharacterized protein LOC131221904 isoform X2 n=1 Tax=Magnolia sinica TaxID=86752 RepID=UPI0026582CD4|nr:uncharacterized protein LOC131221904 isoform X2 [Magnolia sinica]
MEDRLNTYQTLEFPLKTAPNPTRRYMVEEEEEPGPSGRVRSDGREEGSDSSRSAATTGDVLRMKSLTDGDLDELKGCLDLGFGFNYEEIPELCNTLPALELCYSMSQRFLDDQRQQQQKSMDGRDVEEACSVSSAAASPITNWKISSPWTLARSFVG